MFITKYVYVVMRETTYGTAAIYGVFSDKDKAIKDAKRQAEERGWEQVGEHFDLGEVVSMLYWDKDGHNGKGEYVTYTISHERIE